MTEWFKKYSEENTENYWQIRVKGTTNMKINCYVILSGWRFFPILEISGLCRDVVEVLALLDCYAAYFGTYFTDVSARRLSLNVGTLQTYAT